MNTAEFAVAVALGVSAPAMVSAAVTAGTPVTVRVYDVARLPAATRADALRHTAAALARAGVEAVWQVCGARDVREDDACRRPLEPGELSVRVVRAPVPPGHKGALPLGDALIDARTGASVLATIYLDRVVWMARAAGTETGVVLGRAIAHELGHLIMASASHAPRGLMRATWSRDDLRRNRDGDWDFARDDVVLMTARLTRPAPAH